MPRRARCGHSAFSLRSAADADSASIAAIWHAGWLDGHEGLVPPELARFRTAASFVTMTQARLESTTVAVANDELVGFVVAHDDEVEQLYVRESARGSGVADQLIASAELSIARRHSVAWLAVVAGNHRARRFYGRCGWLDAGSIDYQADAAGSSLPVPARRYEKIVRSADAQVGRRLDARD